MTKDELNNHLSNRQKGDAAGELARLEANGLVRKGWRDTGGRRAAVWELVR
jgi:hypothetical protein